MPIDEVRKMEAEIKQRPYESKVSIYKDAIHGFSCRGDLENDLEHKQKEDALKEAIAWFRKFA
jgi:dienelactone hydrolase